MTTVTCVLFIDIDYDVLVGHSMISISNCVIGLKNLLS